MLIVMAVFFLAHDPYRDVGDDLLAGSGGFDQQPAAAWQAGGKSIAWEPHGGVDSSGAMRLGVDSAQGSRFDFRLDDPGRFRFLRLSGRLRTEGIVEGEAPWNTARLLLLFSDRDGNRLNVNNHVVCELTGTQPWRNCEHVFAVPESAVAAHVHVQNLAAAGMLWVDDLRLTPATEKPLTSLWTALFALLWSGALAYCLWAARLGRRWFGIPIMAIGLLIIVAATVPQAMIEETVDLGAGTVKGVVKELRPHFEEFRSGPDARPTKSLRARFHPARLSYETVNKVKKLGHFTLFGLLAFLAFLSAARYRAGDPHASGAIVTYATVAAALLLFAIGIEVLQFLSTTRGPSLIDWGIDAAGVAVGAFAAWITHRSTRNTVRADHAA